MRRQNASTQYRAVLNDRDQHALLAYLAKRLADKKLGKKAYQKIVYLLEQFSNFGTGYNFSFYTYGVFSKTLAMDMDILAKMGALSVSYSDQKRAFEIAPGEHADEIVAGSQLRHPQLSAQIDAFVDRISEYNAWQLELLSTAAYVSQVERASSPEEMKERIKQLKPKFSAAEIEKSLEQWAALSA